MGLHRREKSWPRVTGVPDERLEILIGGEQMELGPFAEDILDIVDLVESGVIFRNPRPPLDPDLKVIRDVAEAGSYRFTDPAPQDGTRLEWMEVVEFAGDPRSKREVHRKESHMFDSIPDLVNNLGELMENRINIALDKQLKGKYNEDVITSIYCTLNFIMSLRATFGRSLPFIERLVTIYRLGGHPCGWVGPYPEGRLVAYFPAGND